MSAQFPGGDTLPWYRQFWPWFLILLPGSVVVAGLSTVYIANRHADDLVVDDYYKDGLAINRQLEKIRRAEERGIGASLELGGGVITVALSGTTPEKELRLLLSHPLEADRDFTVSLARLSAHLYQGRLTQTVAPRWHWTLEAPGADGWRLDGVIKAGDFSHAASD